MWNNETRNLLVNAYQKHGNADLVASMKGLTATTRLHTASAMGNRRI